MASSPPLSQLLMALNTPRGIMAVTAVIGSLVALVYLYAFGTGKSTGKRAGKTSQTKSQSASNRSTPKKSPAKKTAPNQKATPPKSDSAKKATSKGDSESEQTKNSTGGKAPAKSSSSDKKDSKKAAGSANAAPKRAPTKVAPIKQQNKTVTQAQSKAQKDDGEWITVAKKKPRLPANKKTTDEDSSPSPQSRTSARRSTASRPSYRT